MIDVEEWAALRAAYQVPESFGRTEYKPGERSCREMGEESLAELRK